MNSHAETSAENNSHAETSAENKQTVSIYDIALDQNRPVTQADVDRLQAIANAYGATRYILRRLFRLELPYDPLSVDWNAEATYLKSIALKIDDLRAHK